MGVKLRGYQHDLQEGVVAKWQAGAQCVMMTTATGGGKTATMASTIANKCHGRGIVQAHRSELVGQLSIALAKEGVMHDLTCNPTVRRQIIDAHLDKLGRSYYSPRADWSVESVDTALRKPAKTGVDYVFQDEGHHVLYANKWGRALQMYPAAKWLLATATAGRADGKGLGAHSDGVVNALHEGPGLGQLMGQGYLVPYDILHPTASDLDLRGVHIGPNGEFNQAEVAQAVKQSNKIVGDAVAHYLEHARDRLCIVFAVDIEHATTLLKAYLAAGVAAELVTGKDLDTVRLSTMKRFERRETLVLINVDLFGEGTDVPGVEVVQMCRPTASFPLFVQQIGRMLRLDISAELMSMWEGLPIAERLNQIATSRKPRALLIDHVGNIFREFNICGLKYSGPPEGFSGWALDGKQKRNTGGAIPERICLGCYAPFMRFLSHCPNCGHAVPEPDEAARSDVKHVDGNLQWYNPELLAKMRAEIARVDGSPILPAGLSTEARIGAVKAWHARQKHQHYLRESIAQWAGRNAALGGDDVLYRLFYFKFGTDVLGAMALGASDAEKLKGKIDADN